VAFFRHQQVADAGTGVQPSACSRRKRLIADDRGAKGSWPTPSESDRIEPCSWLSKGKGKMQPASGPALSEFLDFIVRSRRRPEFPERP